MSCAFRIVLAAILGGIIGLERERQGRPAGLRTHILVCIGSSICVIAGLYSCLRLGFTSSDPLRVAAQVISGIGFLGAGTIITRHDNHVIGLTTAAGLWATAAIGLLIGVGFYLFAVIATTVMILVTLLLRRLEHYRKTKRSGMVIYLEIDKAENIQAVADIAKPAIVSITPPRSGLPGNVGMCVSCIPPVSAKVPDVLAQLKNFPNVIFVIEDE